MQLHALPTAAKSSTDMSQRHSACRHSLPSFFDNEAGDYHELFELQLA